MAIKYSTDQQKVIDKRNANILVSAAAGSGKTAVLVARIIGLIGDDNSPDEERHDIDSILIVTFTKAAAAEMRGRIRKAIVEKVKDNPKDKHLRRQMMLINNAHICTIDSFCSYVVKNYFYEIGLESSRRTALDDELKVLQKEVALEILERRLQEDSEGFRTLCDIYIKKINVNSLLELIIRVNTVARSYPYPTEWLQKCLSVYTNLDDNSDWIEKMVADTKREIDIRYAAIEQLYGKADAVQNTSYANLFRKYMDIIEPFRGVKTYEDIFELCQEKLSFPAKVSVRSKEYDVEFNDLIDYVIEPAKTFMKTVSGDYSTDLNAIFEEMRTMAPVMQELVSLVLEFDELYSAKKARAGIADFSDIEHMALAILRDDSDEHNITECARALRDSFTEIMVDEYQDSNYLQEAILTALVKDGKQSNYFNVGDVKQSIYRFRQASPELFIKKSEEYPKEDGTDSIRIDLSANYRSRRQVLEFCNKIFEKLMTRDTGKIVYDDAARLVAGSKAYDGLSLDGSEKEYEPEIMLYPKEHKENEPYIVAEKIKDLMDNLKVTEMYSDNGEDKFRLRDLRYSDIALLFTSTKNAQEYIDVLASKGIPAYAQTDTGYFTRIEIETVLAALSVIANPLDDVSLYALLHSAMFGMSDERLFEIKSAWGRDKAFIEIIQEYKEDEKIAQALQFIDDMRELAGQVPIHVVIEEILERTGYYEYAASLNDGRVRAANLMKLISEATNYESNGYASVDSFVKYINTMRTYEVEKGIASINGENEDVVKIMTIHKSKGLEFPVVFLCSASTDFVTEKADDIFFVSAEQGLSVKCADVETRKKYDSLYLKQCRKKANLSSKEERLRVLYVALTRAKEKLIVLGTDPRSDAGNDFYEEIHKHAHKLEVMSCNNYMNFIFCALKDRIYETNFIEASADLDDENESDNESDIMRNEQINLIKIMSQSADSDEINKITESIDFPYKKSTEKRYKMKYSVSEIKHVMMDKYDADSDNDASFGTDNISAAKLQNKMDEFETFVSDNEPVFAKDRDENTVLRGSDFGDAVHRYFESFDFAREDFDSAVEDELERITAANLLTQIQYISLRKRTVMLESFLKSELARRMHAAALNNNLFREQRFVYMAPAKEVMPDEETSTEEILIQGIIDVFFVEENDIILLDYKTDKSYVGRLSAEDEQHLEDELKGHYTEQLRLYEKAIEASFTGKKVKESYLYSTKLRRSIKL